MPITEQLVQSRLSADLQAILRCLGCGGKLESDQCRRLSSVRPANAPIPTCKGIARFVDAQHYAASFGFQWHRYQTTQLDHDEVRESERNFRMKTALRPEELKGKLVLDVGCGMGRFAEVATRWGARVVGIDLSAAAEVAAKNLADRSLSRSRRTFSPCRLRPKASTSSTASACSTTRRIAKPPSKRWANI